MEGVDILESEFQSHLIERLKLRFPGCVVLKNDSSYLQGFLDLTLLYENTWAALEVKAGPRSALQANQKYYVHQLDEMSFAAVIYPENEEEVLSALQKAFASRRCARIPQS